MPFPSPGDLPDPGIAPRSPTLWADSLLSEPPGKPPSVAERCSKLCAKVGGLLGSKGAVVSGEQARSPESIVALRLTWVPCM